MKRRLQLAALWLAAVPTIVVVAVEAWQAKRKRES